MRHPISTLLALLLAAACDSGAKPAPPDPGAGAATCTGTAPDHATLCPGADQGLAADAPRVLLAGGCDATACAYACDPGFAPAAGACAAVPDTRTDVVVTDNGDGTVTVTDGYAELVWLRDGRCMEPLGGVPFASDGVRWLDALLWAAALGDGACGLADGSAPGDWTLPGPGELAHLQPALEEAGERFANVSGRVYWTDYWLDDWCGAMPMPTGAMFMNDQDWHFFAWPVRRR